MSDWYMLERYGDPKRVEQAYYAVTHKWNWFEEQDQELWNLVKEHKASEVRWFDLPVEKCEHEKDNPDCWHGWPSWFCDEVRELLQELSEVMEEEEADYLPSLNLEDSEERALVTCRDYVAAYVLQYEADEREAFESFCRSAVIDATESDNEELVSELYAHLDPDGKDADITVAGAGKILRELISKQENE